MDKAEALMSELGIPTVLQPFIASFGLPYCEDISEGILATDPLVDQIDKFLGMTAQNDLGAYVPQGFLTNQDGSLAEFLKPLRRLTKAILASITDPTSPCPPDVVGRYFVCLVKIMQIQANSPFAICHLTAITTCRNILTALAAVLTRGDLERSVIEQLSRDIRLPCPSFDTMLRGEIGFAYFSSQKTVSEQDIEEWKQSIQATPELKAEYRRAVLQQKLPGLSRKGVAKHIENKCFALQEFRRLGSQFRIGDFTAIMNRKSVKAKILRSLVGEGSSFSFEVCLSFERAVPDIQGWISQLFRHILDPEASDISFESEYIKYSVRRTSAIDADIVLKFLNPEQGHISIQRTVS